MGDFPLFTGKAYIPVAYLHTSGMLNQHIKMNIFSLLIVNLYIHTTSGLLFVRLYLLLTLFMLLLAPPKNKTKERTEFCFISLQII